MTTDELRLLLPPPTAPASVPAPSDWQRAETSLGTRLPADYKDFLATYGSGRIDDFLEIANPASRTEHNELIHFWRDQQPVFDYMARGGSALRYDLHPAVPGLLPLGITDNGDTIFYVTSGDADEWKIGVLESRGNDVVVFDGGLTSFLCAALRHEVDAFPRNFPRPAPTFVPAAMMEPS